MSEHFTPQPDEPQVLRHAALSCPWCATRLDSAARPDGSIPTPPVTGDFTLCLACVNVAVFEVGPLGVALRQANEHDMSLFLSRRSNVRALRLARRVRREYPGGSVDRHE